eukprot:1212022-Alexandrium_andersonii.AAC.1
MSASLVGSEMCIRDRSGTLQTFSEGISGIRDEVASQKLRAEQVMQRQEAENSRMQSQIDALA